MFFQHYCKISCSFFFIRHMATKGRKSINFAAGISLCLSDLVQRWIPKALGLSHPAFNFTVWPLQRSSAGNQDDQSDWIACVFGMKLCSHNFRHNFLSFYSGLRSFEVLCQWAPNIYLSPKVPFFTSIIKMASHYVNMRFHIIPYLSTIIKNISRVLCCWMFPTFRPDCLHTSIE